MAKFIPLSVPNFEGHEKEYVCDAVVSEWVSTGGSKVGDFEKVFADYVGMPRAVACNSGSSAMHLTALVAGIGRGDEVIVPTLTFIASVNPLTRYVGAEPVFIGCDDSAVHRPGRCGGLLPRTSASCGPSGSLTTGAPAPMSRRWSVVHVFGNMADMPRLLDIAQKLSA